MAPMPDARKQAQDPAHDVLAAEEFPVPAPDPTLHEEPAHDVLAAEEFAMPAPDPAIHHGPVALPADLTGDDDARDVLAAEEFAMPAAPAHVAGRPSPRGGGAPPGLVVLALLFVAWRLVRHRLRRR
jgi:hypothetical protein